MKIKLFKDALKFIDSWLKFYYANNQYTGFTVGVYYKNKMHFSNAYGFANTASQEPLTTQHFFRIASHSKMFTATAIMQLVEAGKIQLDTPIQNYLSWFKSSKDKRFKEVTARQLLSHSAGIIRDGKECDYWQGLGKFPNKTAFKKDIKNCQLVYDPNTIFKYTNYGYGLLGLLIEKVSGQAFNDYLQTNILDPIGLTNCGPDITKEISTNLAIGYSTSYLNKERIAFPNISTGALSPATGMYSTVEDLCLFGAQQFHNTPTFLSETSKKEMHRLQWKPIKESENSYGLGFSVLKVGKRNIVGHGGGFPGFSSNTRIDVKDKLVVSVISNSNEFSSGEIANGIIKTIDFFQSKADKKANPKLKKFTGRFYSIWGIREVALVGGELVICFPTMKYPFGFETKITHQGGNVFKIDDFGSYGPTGEELIYHFDKNNKIEKVKFGGLSILPLEKFEATFYKNKKD